MKRIVLASNNAGKLAELQAMLAPLGVELVKQGDLNIPEADEPFHTFVENALAKARHASRCAGLPAVADDAGETLMKLIEVLDDHDDVQNVYGNYELSDTLMAKLAG